MFFQIEPATFMKTDNESKLTLLVYIEHGEQMKLLLRVSQYNWQLGTHSHSILKSVLGDCREILLNVQNQLNMSHFD